MSLYWRYSAICIRVAVLLWVRAIWNKGLPKKGISIISNVRLVNNISNRITLRAEIFSCILTVGDSLLLLRIYLYIASQFAETFPENPGGLMLQ